MTTFFGLRSARPAHGEPSRRRASVLVTTLLVAVLVLAAGAHMAQAASPGWQLLSVTGPTNLKPFSSEEQTVTGALLGTYTLTFRGDTTVPLAGTASADDLAAALNALPSIAAGGGSVSVRSTTGDTTASTYVVTFDGGPLAGTDVPLMSATGGFFVPASVSPTPVGTIAVYATNVGGAITAGPITASIALPDGITTTATPAGTGQTTGAGWSCTPAGSGHSVVSCATTNTVAPGTNAQAIGVPVQVGPGVSGTKTARVTISGGGATDPATYDEPITISKAPASAGVQAFWAGAFDEDGKPATQAGGHPYQAITGFLLNTIRAGDGSVTPAGDLKNARVDLPPGFIGNPQAASKCPGSGTYRDCSSDAIVGLANPIFSYFGQQFKENYMVFQTTPDRGDAAQFVFNALSAPTVLTGSVRSDGDFGPAVTAANTPQKLKVFGAFVSLWGVPGDPSHDPYRCSSTGVGVGAASFPQGGTCASPNANSNQKAFLSNPTDCAAEALSPPVTVLGVNSYQFPGVFSSASYGSPPVTNCGALPFAPSMSVLPTVASADAPTGLDVKMHFPQDGLTDRDGLATAHLKKATVTLPEGLTISPGAANGLAACSDADLQLQSKAPVRCPDAAKIGTATAITPLLAETLTGSVYMRTQHSTDPESGEMFRIALTLENEERGISVRLPGEIQANAHTGRLVATFDNNPRLPVGDIKLRFKGGSTAPLATPMRCDSHRIMAALTSWGGQSARLPSTFSTACTPGLGWFGPNFAAGTVSPVAAGSSAFNLVVARQDGEKELKAIKSVRLPEGLLGRVSSVPLCGEAQAAAGTCPEASRVGHVQTALGAGSSPLWVPQAGKEPTAVYLSGPYRGAPYSLSIVVPAQAGPYDLGKVVVRSALHVDERTTQITSGVDETRLIDTDGTVTDVLPEALPLILKGIVLRQREIRVIVDRDDFIINPTDCSMKEITAEIYSGDDDRADVNNRFRAADCALLGFKPRFRARILDKGRRSTLRSFHPRTRFVVRPRKGNANIGGARVALPSSTILDQANIGTTCTRAQMAARDCPERSIVGYAKAWSPLLRKAVEGPVYLAANGGVRPLPDLAAVLDGEIRVVLQGEVSTLRSGGKARLQNTFRVVPDAPVDRFVLTMRGGKKRGLLVNSTDLCRSREKGVAAFIGQNNRRSRGALRIIPSFKGCGKVRRQAARRKAASKSAMNR